MTTHREWLQAIVDRLADDRLEEAAQRLAPLLRRDDDPVFYAFANAPMADDEESLTDEDLAAIEQGREEIRRGEGVLWEDVRDTIGTRHAVRD